MLRQIPPEVQAELELVAQKVLGKLQWLQEKYVRANGVSFVSSCYA